MLDGTWSHGASWRIWLQSWYLELWDHCIGASQRICAICTSSTNESPLADDSGGAAITAKLCHWKILHWCACCHLQLYPPSTGESFSRSFKEMVRMCLQKEARKRPTVQTLMNCKFFKTKWPVGPLVNELLCHVGNISVMCRRFKLSNYFLQWIFFCCRYLMNPSPHKQVPCISRQMWVYQRLPRIYLSFGVFGLY